MVCSTERGVALGDRARGTKNRRRGRLEQCWNVVTGAVNHLQSLIHGRRNALACCVIGGLVQRRHSARLPSLAYRHGKVRLAIILHVPANRRPTAFPASCLSSLVSPDRGYILHMYSIATANDTATYSTIATTNTTTTALSRPPTLEAEARHAEAGTGAGSGVRGGKVIHSGWRPICPAIRAIPPPGPSVLAWQ